MILLTLCAMLAGCATPEYRQARNQCTSQAFQRFPVNNVSQVVTVRRQVEVPTGETNCTTDYSGSTARTSCKQVTRLEMRSFNETEVADTNESARNNAINYCAAQSCMSSYGNSDCKKAESSSSANAQKQNNCTAEANAYVRNKTSTFSNAYDACMRR
jgi:hypothetical protein